MEESDIEKNIKGEVRQRAGVNICDTNESSEIREYANIKEIKEMNNMLFYKKLIKELIYQHVNGNCNNLCYIKGKITMYDAFKEDEDVFVKMENSCVWLKKTSMDTTAMNISNIMGNVNMLGYILREETNENPRVIKALAIYV